MRADRIELFEFSLVGVAAGTISGVVRPQREAQAPSIGEKRDGSPWSNGRRLAVKAISRSKWTDSYGSDSGPSRGELSRRAIPPNCDVQRCDLE